MSSNSSATILEEATSNGEPYPTPSTKEVPERHLPTQEDNVAQKTLPPRIDHIADYAIAINRSLCKSRAPKDRIFQVGGRRRLLFASAAAIKRLQPLLDVPNATASWPKELCGVLADLAVGIADGIFRNQSHETTARLLTFVIAKLQMPLADTTRLELENKLCEMVARAANSDIAATLNNGFEWRPIAVGNACPEAFFGPAANT
jgi:hypothetical protein